MTRALLEARACASLTERGARVSTAVTNRTRQQDFDRANIADVDGQGRVADLHALRGTLGTRIAREGIAPQVAQQLMRHSDYRLTLKHYTMLTLADAATAMRRLPGISALEHSAAAWATGTEGAPLVDPQQIPQQSAHETARDGATSSDVVPSAQPSANGSNGLRLVKLRDAVRAVASKRAGAPATTRTWDRRFRKPMLYPAELRALGRGV